MRKEIIETGKDLDQVIDAACARLGQKREDCEIEILQRPKKSFFGLKSTPYKIKVFIDLPDEKPAKPPVEDKPPMEDKSSMEDKPSMGAAPARQPDQKPPQPRREKAAPPKPAPKKQERRDPPPPKPAPARAEGNPSDGAPAQTENHPEKIRTAEEYVSSILKAMGLDAELRTEYSGESVCINVEGQGLGMIIGRRGETLDSIQYLAGLVANRLEGDYLRVTIDCGDYRTKRKETLESLARKLSSQVLKTNVSKTLEPMNPFERRIIHATVSEIEGVSSLSVGEEPNRRVIITSPTAKSRSSRPRRDGDRDFRSGPPRDRRDRDRRPPSRGPRDDRRPPRAARPAPPVQEGPPKKTPEASSENPLYTKIDLE